MDFSTPRPQRANLALLPTINVAFLLVIFFLLAGEFRQNEPFATEPPETIAATEAEGLFTLHLAADLRLGFRDRIAQPTDDAARQEVIGALRAARAEWCETEDCANGGPSLMIRADRGTPGRALAALLPQLATLGFGEIAVISATRQH